MEMVAVRRRKVWGKAQASLWSIGFKMKTNLEPVKIKTPMMVRHECQQRPQRRRTVVDGKSKINIQQFVEQIFFRICDRYERTTTNMVALLFYTLYSLTWIFQWLEILAHIILPFSCWYQINLVQPQFLPHERPTSAKSTLMNVIRTRLQLRTHLPSADNDVGGWELSDDLIRLNVLIRRRFIDKNVSILTLSICCSWVRRTQNLTK